MLGINLHAITMRCTRLYRGWNWHRWTLLQRGWFWWARQVVWGGARTVPVARNAESKAVGLKQRELNFVQGGCRGGSGYKGCINNAAITVASSFLV